MKLTKIISAAVLTLCASFAENLPPERSGEVHDFTVRAKAKLSASDTTDTGNSEVFRNVVIAAGTTVSLDSTLDYSSASTVAITVQCITCTTASTALGALSLTLQARWLVPNADFYVATENKSATAFLYWDAGGALFNVYGSLFRLSLQNKGSQTISIQQVTLLRRSQ
jgi:hypothetical protein